jgi:hypothetical protein
MTRDGRIRTVAGVAAFVAAGLITASAAVVGHDADAIADYNAVLAAYVDVGGRVDYGGLKENPGRLDRFAHFLATVDSAAYDAQREKVKIAFWINAYNALTLEAILHHYPIEPLAGDAGHAPANSIREILGVWDDVRYEVMGRRYSLNAIENDVLRAHFHEPRIHMALVCAAVGCPPLRREAYSGATLDEQLDDQAKRFLSLERNFRIDHDANVVYISAIFDWYGDDFRVLPQLGTIRGEHSDKERAALNFILGYVGRDERSYIESGLYVVRYLDYDWSLNVQVKPAKG